MHRAPSESDESDTEVLALGSRLLVPIRQILNKRCCLFGGTQSNELNVRIALSRHQFIKLAFVAGVMRKGPQNHGVFGEQAREALTVSGTRP